MSDKPEPKAIFDQVAKMFENNPEIRPEWLKGPDAAYTLALIVCNADLLFGRHLSIPRDALELIPKERWEELPEATPEQVSRDIFELCFERGHEYCKQIGFTGKYVCPIPAHQLTEAEKEVLEMSFQGHSTMSIALNRKVSENTVKTQIKRIFAKLRVSSKIEAMNQVLKGE